MSDYGSTSAVLLSLPPFVAEQKPYKGVYQTFFQRNQLPIVTGNKVDETGAFGMKDQNS